ERCPGQFWRGAALSRAWRRPGGWSARRGHGLLPLSQTASHWEVRLMTRSLLSWLRGSSGPKPPRRAAPRRAIVPRLDPLEDRTLLSAQFTPAPYAVPANRPDTPLTHISPATPVEPYLSVNPADPGDIAVSSQNGIRVSTTAGGSFISATRFPVAGNPGD